MIRRKTLHVISLPGSAPWRPQLPAVRQMLVDLDEAGEGWASKSVSPYGKDTSRPDYSQTITRGPIKLEICHPGFGNTMMVQHMINDGWTDRINVPITPGAQPEGPAIAEHLCDIIDSIDAADDHNNDMTIFEEWALGLAGICRSLGGDPAAVTLPNPWVPMHIDDRNGTFPALPTSVRRRITNACPWVVTVEAEPPDPHPIPGSYGFPEINIGDFGRMFTTDRGKSTPTIRSLRSEPIATMRAVAMILIASGLTPEDIVCKKKVH